MIFKTEFSCYEIDQDLKRIRRLSGATKPTDYGGEDRVWKNYLFASEIVVGSAVLVAWGLKESPEPGKKTVATTLTSAVTEINLVIN